MENYLGKYEVEIDKSHALRNRREKRILFSNIKYTFQR